MIRQQSLPWFFQAEITSKIDLKLQKHFKAKRLSKGQNIILFNGLGQKTQCKIICPEEVEILNTTFVEKSTYELRLAVAYCDLKVLNNIIIKATELGVSNIDIIHSEYSYSSASHKKITDKHVLKWQVLMQQACQQSENPYLPKLTTKKKLAEHLVSQQQKQIIVLGFAGTMRKLSQDDTVLYVGPEGGFSKNEAELFQKHNANCLTISNNVLRVETAATAGLGVLNHLITTL